ncbi:AAA family ATPase [Porphyromonadaceae sp. NP-X]|jgi:predicted ATPase|nr:AAA family ATPase [Porphyromonadaceae sp. NP-X]
MKINKIGFENFRVFKDKSLFELAPITVLTGANNSGKSTVIKGLKLFQNFWGQNGFKDKLEFEKGIHQLGDFEMALSKYSDNKELIVTYEFDHIVFGTLTVELIFQLEDSSQLKNGILRSARIKKGDNKLFGIVIEDHKQLFGYNYKYILNELLPLLKSETKKLKPEIDSYNELIREDYGNGLTGLNTSKANLRKLKIDEKRYWDLENLFRYDFSENFNKPSNFPELNKSISPFIYDLEILDVFSSIEKTNSFNFIDEFWKILSNKYPDIGNRFDSSTFKNYIDKLQKDRIHIDLWKESFLLSKESRFDQFLKSQIELSHEIISKMIVSSPIDIDDIEGILNLPFYNPMRVLNGTIWQNFYEVALNSETQTIYERAVINCHQIISDALYLERILLNKDTNNRELTVFPMFENFFTNLFKEIEYQFSQMYFIDSIKATSQRLYLFDNQNINFSEFIVSFLKCNFKEKEKQFISKWLQEFEIADKFEIELVRGVGSEIFLIKGTEKINLVDMGYGVTQFLPILLKIVYCNNINKKIIVIEEPETNLHPKFQSKLADLFIDAYNTFNIQFVVETHSEYFIRKLQFLTAKRDVETTDSIIYYLLSPDKNKREIGEEQIREIHIQSNGRLSKPFGSGFYDEADNLSIEMMKYSLN